MLGDGGSARPGRSQTGSSADAKGRFATDRSRSAVEQCATDVDLLFADRSIADHWYAGVYEADPLSRPSANVAFCRQIGAVGRHTISRRRLP